MGSDDTLTAKSADVKVSLRSLAREVGVSHEMVRQWLRNLGAYSDPWIAKAYVALKSLKLRFYTTPPVSGSNVTPWPWVLVNVFSVSVLETVLERYRELGARVESVIVDSGVDKYWRKPYGELPADYDSGYWEKFWDAVDVVKRLSARYGFSYEVVVPDYPDDYTHIWGKKHALWTEECSDLATNVDRTMDNALRFVDADRRMPWLVPIQGYEDIPMSIAYTLADAVSRIGTKYRYALANLCTSKKAGVIAETIRLARSVCNNCSFHVFGPGLSGVRKALRLGLLRHGDSWDSTAWTFPRGNGWSCKNSYERFLYFQLYLKHVYEAVAANGQG